jgi:threonine synthase
MALELVSPLSMGEGNTPIISLPQLAKLWGVKQILAKAEYLNPTGSYKDRIALATMEHALRNNFRGWLGTSSGNGGAAMAAYGARAGIPGILCVLADAPAEKLSSIRPYGALMLPVKNLGLAEMEKLFSLAREENLILTITAYAYNPEGMKGAELIGEEIAQHASPTHVYVPTGGGGLLVAVATGIINKGNTAKVICAQPAGCSPIVKYLNGEISEPFIINWATQISGVQLPQPPDGIRASEMVRASSGWGTGVIDEDIWAVQSMLAKTEGVFVEPASALALAALRQDIANGKVSSDDSPMVILTGSGLKDLRRFGENNASDRTAIEIDDIEPLVKGWPV